MKKYEKLDNFFEQIKNLSFWQRVFSWKPVQRLSYEAFEEYKNLIASAGDNEERLSVFFNKIELLNNTNSHIKIESEKMQSELNSSKEEVRSLQRDLAAANEKNAVFKKIDGDRRQSYETKAETLTAITARVENEREAEKQRNQEKEMQHLKSMKETWEKHETSVREAIKRICQKHTIDYVDQVPFKGKPDNTIQICEEYIIFDAKSPSSDDLTNFPTYIKSQAELVKKYIKEQNVRKDIFFVIPSNTVNVIENFSFNMGEYNAYVVTVDVLEPLILALRKIEDYEFVDQLTPEDRENICRIMGKLTHFTKRKMQVDLSFMGMFLDILKKSAASLPEDIQKKVDEYERSEKINPPIESRTKQIPMEELEAESEIIHSRFQKMLPQEPARREELPHP